MAEPQLLTKNETPKTNPSKFDMTHLLGESKDALNLPKVSDLIEGRVIRKNTRSLYLDLGASGIGIIYGLEFIGAQDIIKNLKPGDLVSAKITDLENEEGFTELSLREARSQKSWNELIKKQRSNETISTKILSANRGGLIVQIDSVQGFLPVSQLSQEHYPRVEGGDKTRILSELQKFIGQNFTVCVIDVDPKEEKLIVSEKATREEDLKENLNKYKIGDIVEGDVTGLVDWGAFMRWGDDAEKLEGLIHISEFDWQMIENLKDFIKVGSAVKAQIIDISGNKVSLSIKRLKANPWQKAAEVVKNGDIVFGQVTKFNPFGAFVEILLETKNPEGLAATEQGEPLKIQGLCHISEFGSEEKMTSLLELNKNYQFKIVAFEPSEHRISLSLNI